MNKLATVFLILCCVGSCSKKITPSVAVSATKSTPNALALYNNFCVRCHGDGGYSGKAPNLAKFAGDKNAALQIISSGAGRMPAFKDRLSETEIDALAGYIISLK